MVKTEVSLEVKVMVVEMVVPEVVWAKAAKEIVPPSVSEVLLLGLRRTKPGKIGLLAFLPPPHPLRLHRERIATASRKAFERNLPMHPSLSLGPAEYGMNRKTCSVEAGDGISKHCCLSLRPSSNASLAHR